MSKELHLGVDDFERLKWRERKELIQFHIDCVEEAKRQNKR
jgi:hypothetical protein